LPVYKRYIGPSGWRAAAAARTPVALDGRTAAQWGEGVAVITSVYCRTPAQQAIDRRATCRTWCGSVYNSIQPTLVAVEAEYNCRPAVLARPVSQLPSSTSGLNDVTLVASLQKHRPTLSCSALIGRMLSSHHPTVQDLVIGLHN